MAIFANGPDYQTYSVGTAPTTVFWTRGFGGTAIAGTVTTHNRTIVNAGTVTLYVSSGTIVTTTGPGTATAAQVLGAGVALLPGEQMVIFGTAVTSGTATWGANVYDTVAATSANVTVTVESGYASQAIVS